MVGKARISVSTLLIILAVSTFAVLIPLRERFLPKGELTVWVGLERPEIGPIEEIAREFERTYQTTVKVVWISDIKSLRARYRVGVPAGAAADVIVGPHDWIGEFVEMGVVADVTDNFRENERGEFLPIALESVRMGNRFWGFPVLLESLVLIYNKSFVSRAPENWEDLIAKALELQREDFHGFYYPHVDPYYSFPILSGYGAYIFGDENVENIGLATEGAILGARFIQDLVHKFHVLP
ncbi:MAG: extracellular solute-binding protein, partial [Candidatus Hadarchaeales archaeon]